MTMTMTMEELLCKHSENYRFHGVRAATLYRLVTQAENSQLLLFGTTHNEEIDNQDGELESEYEQGYGFLYCTDISDIEMSSNEFTDEGGLVLVLEKQVTDPFEVIHPTDSRQRIIKVQEWKVVGGIRLIFGEDNEMISQEVVSLKQILEG